jgi:hypothetical protein
MKNEYILIALFVAYSIGVICYINYFFKSANYWRDKYNEIKDKYEELKLIEIINNLKK